MLLDRGPPAGQTALRLHLPLSQAVECLQRALHWSPVLHQDLALVNLAGVLVLRGVRQACPRVVLALAHAPTNVTFLLAICCSTRKMPWSWPMRRKP